MAIYDSTLWHGAQFIFSDYPLFYDPKKSPWADIPKISPLNQHKDIEPLGGLPMFAKDFEVNGKKSARLVFSALGCIDVWLNGVRIGAGDEMKPGWSSYNKRTFYCEYDVTEQLVEGKNRILAVCSNGWYSGRIAGDYYGGNNPAVMLCLNYEDANGNGTVTTDGTWSATVGGRILFADIWDGEYCDGRIDGYDRLSHADYDISDWGSAEICDYFDGEVSPFIGPTVQVRKHLELSPVSITTYTDIKDNGTQYGEIIVDSTPTDFPIAIKDGQKTVIDFGQNAVGRIRLTVKADTDRAIKVRYAEMLNDSGDTARGNDGPKGSIYTINYRSAKAKEYYICAGGEETYLPTFTFFGYRYVEISANGEYELLDCCSEIVGSANGETGKIETSSELVNQLISNVIWGQRSNYLSVPTDCPQRDERLGWTGDTQAFSRTAAYNADVLGFFRKWLRDMRDSQSEEGAYSDVVPRVFCCQSENASAWGDAGIIVPYNMYVMFGDTQIIEEHYASMEKYIAQLLEKNGYKGAEPRYGDWLAYDLCKNEFISCAYFVHDLDLMIEMSEAISKTDRAEYYRDTREKAYAYFKNSFMSCGRLIGKTQADYAISLNFGLIDGEYAKQVAKKLVELIKENGNRLSTGFLGTYNLCPALSRMGENNMAYTLLLQRNEPSWLYSIDQGATTIWERWNSYTKSRGFGDVGMNSFNHYAYGAIMEWMYRYMAGIETDGVGFKKILLQPCVDTRTASERPDGQERIAWVKASYNSASGLIESAWDYSDGFLYECTVPEGTTATLLLPIFSEEFTANGVTHSFDEYENRSGCAVIALAPGKYSFEQAAPKID